MTSPGSDSEVRDLFADRPRTGDAGVELSDVTVDLSVGADDSLPVVLPGL